MCVYMYVCVYVCVCMCVCVCICTDDLKKIGDDPLHRAREMSKLASSEPSLDFHAEGTNITIEYNNIANCVVNIYVCVCVCLCVLCMCVCLCVCVVCVYVCVYVLCEYV